ncbi:MAG: EAL domain-containing protein [Pseudomonadota bacterium]|nr:EAL domain-containing protein [Pseudomonadota bacterium]
MFRFRKLRTRLAVLYAGLFSLALLALALVAQALILDNARRSVRLELAASSSVYARIWALRSSALSESAELLARDYGFRAAVASGDAPTIQSALDNLRARAGVATAFIVTLDGSVIGDGPAPLREMAAALPYDTQSGRGQGVIVAAGQAYRATVTPVLAPVEVGWIIFTAPLDTAEMRALEGLSAIPLKATILYRQDQAWRGNGMGLRDAPALAAIGNDALASSKVPPRDAMLAGSQSVALAQRLPTIGNAEPAILLLRYPLSEALKPFRPLQIGILLTGLLGLLLVVVGSLRLARGIARPLSMLDEAAKSLEAGNRTEVAIEGDDEIGRLGASFNAMARGIFERENRIAHMSLNDALTGLPNRIFFREQLDSKLRRAKRRGDRLAVLCLDLDNFKFVNDTLGHAIGDELLREVARRLTELAPGDFLARLGADEFALIVAGEEHLMARRIAEALQQPASLDGNQILIGTSIGIAIAPSDGDSADLLLKNAGLALHRAKQDGRGIYRYFEPELDAAARARRQLEVDLREALTEGQFALNFQPIYSSETGRILCFEALLRWEHPTQGLISPDRFIPVAEESGLILRIGEWVLQESCRQARGWSEDIRLAVNVSPRQFRDPALGALIVQALGHSGIDPKRLEIEITESIFLENGDETREMLHKLRGLGVRIALDDFGTGYSSLSYLRNFPFDKLKIDKSFVDAVAIDLSSAAITQAIVDLGNALHIEVTAEGVETQAQFDLLAAQGCTSIQGYLLSRPVSAADALILGRESATAKVA